MGQGSGVSSPWWCGEAVEPSELFAKQPEREGRKEKRLTGAKEGQRGLARLSSGEGEKSG
jgi:hypothetical protein